MHRCNLSKRTTVPAFTNRTFFCTHNLTCFYGIIFISKIKYIHNFKNMNEVEGSDYSGSDTELQDAFAKGLLKPGLNKAEQTPKQFVNNVSGLKQKLEEFQLKLDWVELLNTTNKQAALAPELAAQIAEQEEKQEKGKKRKFSQPENSVADDFKREMMFYRQAQAAVLESIPKLTSLGIPTKRPDDYFAEMAKSDDHMQKVRENLMKKQVQQQRIEKVRQLRAQRKEGKAIQVQTKLNRLQEKKQMLEKIKKVRKGVAKDMDFLNENKTKSVTSQKINPKRKWRDQKYGFGGKKKGLKVNTRDSAADVSEYKRPRKPMPNKINKKTQRPGKGRRIKMHNKGKKSKK